MVIFSPDFLRLDLPFAIFLCNGDKPEYLQIGVGIGGEADFDLAKVGMPIVIEVIYKRRGKVSDNRDLRIEIPGVLLAAAPLFLVDGELPFGSRRSREGGEADELGDGERCSHK